MAENCNKTYYTLTDCSGRYSVKYSLDESLETFIGKIVRVPYYNDGCFRVAQEEIENPTNIVKYIEVFKSYETCLECIPKKVVPPLYDIGECSVKDFEKNKEKLSEIYYGKVLKRRYGVKSCCPDEEASITIKNLIDDYRINKIPTPEVDEPFVDICCLDEIAACDNCDPCGEEAEEDECQTCYCKATIDSEHECNTYTVTVTQEDLDAAVGNTDTTRNNKVFFGYFPCRAENPIFNEYVTPLSEDICVLGIPTIGYFENDVWVELATAVRGDVCEEEIKICCNE